MTGGGIWPPGEDVEPSAGDQARTTVDGPILEGAYRIFRIVGEGGMGTVYEAQQLRLNKRVAIKVMSRELAANPKALARFVARPKSRAASATRTSSTSSTSATHPPASSSWSWNSSTAKTWKAGFTALAACPQRTRCTWSGRSETLWKKLSGSKPDPTGALGL